MAFVVMMLLLIVVIVQFIEKSFSMSDRDDKVDPYNALSIQRSILKILERQLDVQDKQLQVQQKQIELQTQLLTSSNEHSSVLPDLLWWSSILVLCYYGVLFMRRYGIGLMVCVFIHYCSRKTRQVVHPLQHTGMPRSKSVHYDLNTSVLNTNPSTSRDSIRSFGVKYGSETTTV